MPTVADPEVSPVTQTTAHVPLHEPGLWASWRFHIESKLRSLTRRFVNSFAFFEADLDHTVVSMPSGTETVIPSAIPGRVKSRRSLQFAHADGQFSRRVAETYAGAATWSRLASSVMKRSLIPG